jgi:nucleotide-binding universal stress UspA family protein
LHQILFATDFGPASLSALGLAIAIAKQDNAKLTLLHVLAALPSLHADTRWYSQVDWIEQRESARQAALERLRQLIAADANLPCDPEFVASSDVVPRGILSAAEERQADLIVMGVNSAFFVRTAAHIPWTVAHEVVRHAKCPVLTVRSRARAE